MASGVPGLATDGGWATIAALLADDGSAGHPLVARLSAPRAAIRDLSDAIHCLCLLHGHRPGVLDVVAERSTHNGARAFLADAAAAFAEERGWFAKLVSAAGPLPSTPGQAETEATIIAQCHALVMLGRSERTGTATGAALGLVLDWPGIRQVLAAASERLGINCPPCRLPPAQDAALLLAASQLPAPVQRAMAFGAQQVLAQHRGLWNLLDARVEARLYC